MKWFVPGRLEVLGKHTDYAGGSSLLAALGSGVTVTLEPAEAGITATTAAVPGAVRVDRAARDALPGGHWGRYLQTVVDRLEANFGPLLPARIHVDSTLPLASGMSSSSALMVGVALCLIDHNNLRATKAWRDNIFDDIDFATYMSTVENGMSFGSLEGKRGVGTFGGSEDHTGMICSSQGMLGVFQFCPTRKVADVALPDGWVFVVAMSGVPAEKTGAARDAYNRASQQARELVDLWNQATGASELYLADVLASGEVAADRLRALAVEAEAALASGENFPVNSGLVSRLDAFVTESEVLIPRAVEALAAGDVAAFGEVANLSHENARDVLGNQIPQTNLLQELALSLGAVGSTSFGAGFGGSVWALVRSEDAEAFGDAWLEAYGLEFPGDASRASIIIGRPGKPAHRV